MVELIIAFCLIFLAAVLVVCIFMLLGINAVKAIVNPKEVVKGNGDKKALLLYQPSRHSTAKNVTEKIADVLVEKGYKVIINHPSEKIDYDLEEFEFLGFGSPIYVGRYSTELKKYLQTHEFRNKKVLVYAIGSRIDETEEIDSMYELINRSNETFKIKVSKNTADSLPMYVQRMTEGN